MPKKQKYYVTWTDSFMSGWGRAKGKTNRCYYAVSSRQKATTVKNLLRGTRSDWKNFRVSKTKPKVSPSVHPSYVNPEPWLTRFYRTKSAQLRKVRKRRIKR